MSDRLASQTFFISARESSTRVPAETVGSKAANLARLAALGLHVPPAVVLSTDLCRDYLACGTRPDSLASDLSAWMGRLEEATGLGFGGRQPLLVSVRSSPPVSMPGMLETILDVGLTEQAVHGLIRQTGNPWLAWDAYRRLTRSFAETVHGLAPAPFDRLTDTHLARASVHTIQDLDALSLRDLARASAELLRALSKTSFPPDPMVQLVSAVEAVWKSWNAPRARTYRLLNGLADDTGTGVLIQTMVFGNAGARSGSGVGFTRNPATGDDELYVDFLFNAQGDDIVSGRHPVTDSGQLAAALPRVWADLQTARRQLEGEFLDMQDFEFTVEDGRLSFLQTRAGKRTPLAALRIAVDLVSAGLLDRAAALEQLAAYDLSCAFRSRVQPRTGDAPIARATPASVGAVTGSVAFTRERAQQLAVSGPVILVRQELTTDDLAGLSASSGILTTFGGRTSHAAVVARQLGKVCLVGCRTLIVDAHEHHCSIGDRVFQEGEMLTLDGESGNVYAGRVPIVTERPSDALATIDRWRQRLDGQMRTSAPARG